MAAARHSEHPTAFSKRRKLPLPNLVAFLLSGVRASVQTELDQFFATLQQQLHFCRHVSEQAFAQARAKLSGHALQALNSWLMARVDAWIPRWQGHRLVAADGTFVHFALRASHVPRAAQPSQFVLGLFLPGAELMLAASLHSSDYENERQGLFESLEHLADGDLLLLDRGYPCHWLIAALNHQQRPFCMRIDALNFGPVKAFVRSGLAEQVVTVAGPTKTNAGHYECPAAPQTIRLIRQVAPNGQVRVLATNLLDAQRYPAAAFGDLYHRRWRIEEAFKRLKHRLNLEHVSGLSQLAVMQDVAAKVLCDNLHALICTAAREQHDLPDDRILNRTYAISALKRVLPALLLALPQAFALLQDTLGLLATRSHRYRPNRSKPRRSRPKPHKFNAYKPA